MRCGTQEYLSRFKYLILTVNGLGMGSLQRKTSSSHMLSNLPSMGSAASISCRFQ